ncbi:hypothetical protein JAO71_08460 [Olleya sp. YSTF-M6]|uniref:Uncharacterized protein n=1 Tax=Olleya sediminilitoris TaxID=2795739 RepID=A0ABS1WL46_9FLAO|nr:hypothetical protein [Olleya sediminilitoris]MBL7559833.1 hypothetical protein [Olleya sediminilitoris]
MSLKEKSREELVDILENRKKRFEANKTGLKNYKEEVIQTITEEADPVIEAIEVAEVPVAEILEIENQDIVFEKVKPDEVESKIETETDKIDSDSKASGFDPTASGANKTYNARMKSGYFGRRRR